MDRLFIINFIKWVYVPWELVVFYLNCMDDLYAWIQIENTGSIDYEYCTAHNINHF